MCVLSQRSWLVEGACWRLVAFVAVGCAQLCSKALARNAKHIEYRHARTAAPAVSLASALFALAGVVSGLCHTLPAQLFVHAGFCPTGLTANTYQPPNTSGNHCCSTYWFMIPFVGSLSCVQMHLLPCCWHGFLCLSKDGYRWCCADASVHKVLVSCWPADRLQFTWVFCWCTFCARTFWGALFHQKEFIPCVTVSKLRHSLLFSWTNGHQVVISVQVVILRGDLVLCTSLFPGAVHMAAFAALHGLV